MTKFIKQWRQYWRIAEVRLLFLALLVSVIAITSVGFFTDRADKAMSQQATQLMGGDLIISSSRPIDKGYLSHAKSLGLRTAEMISFPSMVSSGDEMRLARVKAVSAQYPLTGELEITDSLLNKSNSVNNPHLGRNEVWSEAGLFIALGIQPSATVQLGKIEVQLTQRIIKMPDQGLSAFHIAPVLLMPLEQLPETGLLTPASRAHFSQLFAGETTQITAFKTWLKRQLKSSEEIRTLEDGLPAVEQALTRGKRFLALAALLSVILAGAAIALTSYSLNLRETRTVAVLKTLGASRKLILRRYLSQLFLTASLAAILGAAIGYIIQLGIVYLLQDFIDQTLPSSGLLPIVTGFLTAYIMVLGFSAPQLMQLVNIAPVHILQGQKRASSGLYGYALIALLGGTLLLMWIQTQDILLSLFLLVATVLATLLFWFISKGLLHVLRSTNQKLRRRGSLSLPKPNPRISLLMVVFGIGLFSLLLLTALRTDLIARWQASIPDNAPNHFLINIQSSEVKPLQTIFKNKQMTAPLYPMIRGRLVAINNKAVSAVDYTEAHAKRLMTREFNMSAIADLQASNKIVSGDWFKQGESKGLSVEEGIAKTLGLQLGDTLDFDIAGQRLSDKITSLRSVYWDSMQPNFFVLATPSALENYPRTYITSLHVPKEEQHFIPDLIHQYPSITDIDVSSIMMQVKDVISKAAFAVQAIFSFTLVAGIIVLFAALQSQKAERSKEIAILKSIGASRAYLSKHLIIEFTLIGAVAGLIAGVLAVIVANIAAYALFDLSPSINYLLIVSGVLAGAVLVGTAGYFNMRPLLNIAPVVLFRAG
jgi:putative ABC transport system permease protein